MAERVHVREITNVEGNKLLSIVRRGTGSVVRWRRAQVVLWSAQGMDVPQIATIAFTSEDRVREVIHNFNADGFDSLAPKYSGGWATGLLKVRFPLGWCWFKQLVGPVRGVQTRPG
jgi:Helix-turn-helix domain